MTQANNQTNQQHIQDKQNELILVVKRSYLFPNGEAWQGLKEVDFEQYTHIISHKKEFHPRSFMEVDETYKQIIPYLVFKHDNTFFLMQRRSDGFEKRLHNKLTLGIGGHVRQEDMTKNSLYAWAKREFHEEVHYEGNLTITPLGMINDDSNEVGKVHIGCVFLLDGDSANISIKSELKSGILISLDECIQQKELMESWSSHIIEHLQKMKS